MIDGVSAGVSVCAAPADIGGIGCGGDLHAVGVHSAQEDVMREQ